ncbi:putative mitochondrial protein [Andalucia godoyi]|uniref:Putative mitochondrial protein n=1 Tax=Andalucia godoyi TaxID=505711 RepID=A0A8K0F240_ANDGO|nr:putative mitochondrial protein [Andalucia godoyi]|eukprot:ANDGO_00095.mRNA.1 putative mitochondrial protein
MHWNGSAIEEKKKKKKVEMMRMHRYGQSVVVQRNETAIAVPNEFVIQTADVAISHSNASSSYLVLCLANGQVFRLLIPLTLDPSDNMHPCRCCPCLEKVSFQNEFFASQSSVLHSFRLVNPPFFQLSSDYGFIVTSEFLDSKTMVVYSSRNSIGVVDLEPGNPLPVSWISAEESKKIAFPIVSFSVVSRQSLSSMWLRLFANLTVPNPVRTSTSSDAIVMMLDAMGQLYMMHMNSRRIVRLETADSGRASTPVALVPLSFVPEFLIEKHMLPQDQIHVNIISTTDASVVRSFIGVFENGRMLVFVPSSANIVHVCSMHADHCLLQAGVIGSLLVFRTADRLLKMLDTSSTDGVSGSDTLDVSLTTFPLNEDVVSFLVRTDSSLRVLTASGRVIAVSQLEMQSRMNSSSIPSFRIAQILNDIEQSESRRTSLGDETASWIPPARQSVPTNVTGNAYLMAIRGGTEVQKLVSFSATHLDSKHQQSLRFTQRVDTSRASFISSEQIAVHGTDAVHGFISPLLHHSEYLPVPSVQVSVSTVSRIHAGPLGDIPVVTEVHSSSIPTL